MSRLRQLCQVSAAKTTLFFYSNDILAPPIKTDYGNRSPISDGSVGIIPKLEILDENQVPESAVEKPGEHMEVLQSNDNHFPACWLSPTKTEPLSQLMDSHV